MTTTTPSKVFDPPLGWVADHLPQRLAAAYRAAGLDVPPLLRPVEELLAAEPTPAQVEQDVIGTALTADAPETWLDGAVAAWQRAAAVDALRLALARYRSTVYSSAAGKLVAQAAADIAPAFQRSADALAAAATELPPGDDVLDAEAVMRRDATRAFRVAVAELDRLAKFAAIHKVRGQVEVGVPLAAVLPIVEPPEVTAPMEVDRLSRAPLSDDCADERAAVHALARCLREHGADVALVRVVRGDFAGVTLALASGAAERDQRVEHARCAISVKPVDSWGRRVRVRS